ncbi:MAG: nucleoside-diphosphate kinase [Pirellulales bacterium]
MPETKLEQTLVLIKPDALKLSLTGYVLSQLSEFHTGLRFAGLKIVQVTRMLAEEHYAEHRGKFFFPPLIDYIMGRIHYPDDPQKRRVLALAYCGPDAVKKVRAISGPTNPHDARERAPGTIRALGTVVPVKDAQGNTVGTRLDNLVHGSATDAEAEREIKLWFKPNDMMPYMWAYSTDICDEHYYLLDGKLLNSARPNCTCILAPGDVVWKSDLEALRLLLAGNPAGCTLAGVAAKYLINREQDAE